MTPWPGKATVATEDSKALTARSLVVFFRPQPSKISHNTVINTPADIVALRENSDVVYTEHILVVVALKDLFRLTVERFSKC